MAVDQSNQISPAPAEVPRPKKSGRVRVLTVVTLLLILGCGVWLFFLRPHAVRPADASESESDSATTILPLDSFTVNLADQEEGRFLRITIVLGVDGELPAATKGDNKPTTSTVSIAVIRDSVLTVLAQCKSDELLTPDGKTKLKSDLLAALNRDVPALQARQVYFTEFMVQR